MSEEKERFIFLTEKLIESAQYLLDTFYKVKETGKGLDFYEVVRPYANEVKLLNDEWIILARIWVQETKPLYLHVHQINSASDHLEIISIQAFYPETSKKRFLDSAKSVQYILQVIYDVLKGKK